MCDCVNFLEFEKTRRRPNKVHLEATGLFPQPGLRQEILMELEGLEMGTAVVYL